MNNDKCCSNTALVIFGASELFVALQNKKRPVNTGLFTL